MNQITDVQSSCEESIRRSPIASVLTAFLTGVLFRILPIPAILGALIRLLASLARPALLVFGVVKAVELLRERNRS